jgi:hypothetical protein
MSQQENKYMEEGSIQNIASVEDRTSLILSVAALCMALMAGAVAFWEGREMRQVQIQLMYANAIMLREGLVQPGDMVYGPEGNLEYKQHELKRK